MCGCFAMSAIAYGEGSMHDVHTAKILKKRAGPYSGGAQVTLRVDVGVPLNYWVNCNYYGVGSEIIASTNHVLLKRTPTWIVNADHKRIRFALCFVPR